MDKLDCSRHSKQVGGFTDMKLLAEAIGELHYKTLAELFSHLASKLMVDAHNDALAGRTKLADQLHYTYHAIQIAHFGISNAWEISKPYMDKTTEK